MTKKAKAVEAKQDMNEVSLDGEALGKTVDDLQEIKIAIDAELNGELVIADSTDLTRDLYDKTRYGEPLDNRKFQYSLIESLYLMEREKFKVVDSKGKKVSIDEFIKKAKKLEPNFWVRYVVFKDLRKRGYIVKTALKFGADFRVYDRGVKPGEDHARWIVYPVYETGVQSWYEFAAKNRVAHSTRKRLLIGIVDNESDVTYYEIKWIRP